MADQALDASMPKGSKSGSKAENKPSTAAGSQHRLMSAAQKTGSAASLSRRTMTNKIQSNLPSNAVGGQSNTKKPLALIDNGKDVTPRPLFSLKHNQGGAGGAGSSSGMASTATGSASLNKKPKQRLIGDKSQQSGKTGGGGQNTKENPSQFGMLSSMNRSSVGGSQGGGSSMAGSSSTLNEDNESISKADYDYQSPSSLLQSSINGNTIVKIRLTETPTVHLLDLVGSVVSIEDTEACERVNKQNEHYAKVKKNNAISSDDLADRGVQTLRKVYKTQETQASAPKKLTVEVQASVNGDLDALKSKDSHEGLYESSDSTAKASGSLMSNSMMSSQGGPVSESMSQSTATASMSQSSMSTATTTNSKFTAVTGTEKSVLSMVSDLSKSRIPHKTASALLNVAEDAVIKEFNLQKVLTYYDDIIDSATLKNPAESIRPPKKKEIAAVPGLSLLWSFRAEFTKGRALRQVSWNKKLKNMIAGAYGNPAIATEAPGLIVVWSMRNPELPLRVYQTEFPVISIDFSNTKPGLLAAGCSNGSIVVFNVENDSTEPIWTSTIKNLHHFDSVTNLQWCLGKTLISADHKGAEDDETEESLISVGLDGRVLEWRLDRSMECFEIFSIYRISGDKKGEGASLVSPLNPGLSVDVSKKDPSIYLVATQEGSIHQCSRDSSEKYLMTWDSHEGPVYKVLWSPDHRRFLSCSADWTVMMWQSDDGTTGNSNEPIRRYQTGKVPINDISWYPEGTMFASVTDDGRIEIWDAETLNLAPIVTHTVLDRRLTQVSFSPDVDCLVTGDNYGAITVYRMKNISKR